MIKQILTMETERELERESEICPVTMVKQNGITAVVRRRYEPQLSFK